jgi:integrase
VFRQFLDSLGAHLGLKISQIQESDIIRFRDKLASEGRTFKTVNTTVRNLLKRPFTVAVQSGLISKNPVALVRPLKGLAASKEVFTLEQVQSLLAVAQGDWRGLILSGFYLGGRISDLANLQWSNVDLDKGLITFTQSKTGKSVQIPIHSDLQSWLETNRTGITAVFPSLAGRTTGGANGLSQRFAKLMRAAGIDREEIRERSGEKGRVVHGLSFHSLRRTMNSLLANSGVSQEQRMAILGHASKAINTGYTHFSLQSTQSVIAKLPKLA